MTLGFHTACLHVVLAFPLSLQHINAALQVGAVDLASEASKAVRAAKLLSADAAELARSIELAACARGVEAYLAAGSEDNTAYDLSLHVGARPCHTLGALTCVMGHVGVCQICSTA